MVSVCLPSDALLQHLPSYLSFSYLGRGLFTAAPAKHSHCSLPWMRDISSPPPLLTLNVALESITMSKASGGDGILVELFQILKDDAVKVLHSICQHVWETQQWPLDWTSQFSFQSQRMAMPKNAQTTTQLHSSHTLEK